METFPDILFEGTIPGDIGRMSGALFATAFLTGLLGLFQIIDAYSADGRLTLAGYPKSSLLLSRLLTIFGMSILVAVVSFVVFVYSVTPDAPILTFGALVLAGVLYGLIGVLIGSILPRELEGSLALIFIIDSDALFVSGPIDWNSVVTNLFPLHYPFKLLESSVVDGTFSTSNLTFALVYTLLLLLLVVFTFHHTMETEEGIVNV